MVFKYAFKYNINYIWTECCHCFHLTLTHWGRVTHICISNLAIIGSDSGLSPGRRQAIIWTDAGILLIEQTAVKFESKFSLKKIHLKMWSAKFLYQPQCVKQISIAVI